MAKGIEKAQGPDLGYKAKNWRMAGALRSTMGGAKHKHLVFGLVSARRNWSTFEDTLRPPNRCWALDLD